MPRRKQADTELLQAALVGLEHYRTEIEQKMAQLRRMLGVRLPGASAAAKKRTLSAAARKRIAAAQRKRWVEYRKAQKAGKKPAKPAKA